MSSTSDISGSAAAYKKLSHREHVLELPDTYVGSCETHEEWRWILDPTTGKITHRKVAFNPGFYKIFDELIVNARDALVRSRTEAGRTPIKKIDITWTDKAEGGISIGVSNDGDGIPIEIHAEEKVYVPELIFGHLLTSGNYDKTEEKIVGGKNGYGAKLTNIFSTKFSLDVQSPKQGKRYRQVWTANMSSTGKASVTSSKAATGFVSVTYEPELSRFPGLVLEEMKVVLQTRAWELAALSGKEVKVTWQGETIGANTFEKFIKLFLREGGAVTYEVCGPRWEVAAVLTRSLVEEEAAGEDSSRAISFVNGINTRKGGKHVETVDRHVLGEFCELAAKKKVPVKPGQIRDSVVFFVNATIVNPSFDSQTKETLTTPANKFGSVFKSEKLAEGLLKIGLLEEAQAALDAKAAKDAKKTDGSKKRVLRGYPKLVDALWAGTGRSSDCTLILTEGDSAATSAISGLSVVGRERFGVFPLRGKMLNVKDISQEKFNKNEELTAIKAILGLRQGQKYTDLKSLRYGRVMVMADQDHDGSHIKGLLMNLFHTEWPELMRLNFICSLATPLLKASRRGEVLSFYSNGEFEKWREAQPGGASGWTIKYYKGLGTSTKQEALEWFEKMAEIRYGWDDTSDESLSLAFHKKRADDRKTWLENYDAERILDIGAGGSVSYSEFINKELIHFSNADNIRSLPHIKDGLKPSQRKVLFSCFKRGLRSEIKVAQLAGYVSEHAAYHHGEASLAGTIIGMAQNFVGANNINLLVPNGQFGSRLQGGQDAAASRYIFTFLESITDKIFRKEDGPVLKGQMDDGMEIEPETYLPIVPMILVNGCRGIGTGFNTNIPPYNPSDLVRALRERLAGRLTSLKPIILKPWWWGFKGSVSWGDGAWITKGVWELNDEKQTITITELPVGVWTKDYKIYLDAMASAEKLKDGEVIPKTVRKFYTDDGKPLLKGFDDLYTDDEVKFILYFDEDTYEDMKAHPGDFEKRFEMTSSFPVTNMVAFNNDMKIEKFSTVGQILEGYFGPRLAAYETRREKEIERLEAEAVMYDAKARFIRAVLEGTLDLRRKSDDEIVAAMKEHTLPALSGESKDSVDGWEYLLRLRMDRVKATAVKEAEDAVIEARAAVEALRGTTAAQLWLRDLDEFETSWTKMLEARAAACLPAKKGARGGKKKTTGR